MYPILTFLFFFFFFFFFSVHAVENLSNCSQTFNCGSLHNLSYPFTGGARPAHCGPPEFHIRCVNDVPELTIMSLSYRVLSLDSLGQTLSLARNDLWNETCTSDLANSSLASGFFNFSDADNVDVTIFYGCNSSSIVPTPENWFRCYNNQTFDDAYYLIGPVPNDPIMNTFRCSHVITVPILKITAAKLVAERSLFKQAIMGGFHVNFTDPYADHCAKCSAVNRQCGFDSYSNRPICICGNRLCGLGSNSLSRKWIIVIGILAGVSGAILIIVCGIHMSRKRMMIFKKQETNELDFEDFIKNYGSIAPKRYSFSNVQKMTNSFRDQIGKGGYGTVYKGELPDGLLVAVKVLTKSKGNGEEFINEVASIGRTSHVNVVTLLGFCYERGKSALIYEYMPNGSLDKFIHKPGSSNESCRLDWKTLYNIAVGIARGLEYLHRGCNTRILHFDIKPQNILLDKDFCPKISDFGLAKSCITKESIVSLLGTRGTAGYIAPEVFSRNFGGVSHKSDVYSYGMLVLEMVGARKNLDSGVSHTSEMFPHYIYKDLELDNDANNFGAISEEEKDTARKMVLVSLGCIQTLPPDRPSMSKVVEMLEGPLHSLMIPPQPSLIPPTRFSGESVTSSQPSETG
ncbi:LEAF RUST 10 DISEASE-RESISTANCE LOCUS RECEPTOR-LIKE PROTEIN KINASE-like 2.5 [Rosa rugosa]|uniref:LEAF RUST 10 DISEASE-RESISTANCE LOCUS RECEPTOR-LIKE PROTEIN KINASE-like 2.5 n=1 Tax=Rosa rugosa TaxID=74645 RepID=UPI002B40CE7A|nr:LEAF RUST 10 DISEASE-RESISTANCE LOCUS RECEPTOR-LIKE PROTEIN KINASE-like 2.5 [Rosa rugosa]